MRLTVLAVCISFLAFGCTTESIVAPLNVTALPNTIEVSFYNSSKGPITVDSGFALTNNAGHGNLLFIFVDSAGVLHRTCSYIDTLSLDYQADKFVPPSQRSEATSFSTRVLQKLYCLPPDRYTVSAVYFDRRGHLYHSSSVIVIVGQPASRPNNSFKPNALRYTNNMAEQLAMLLAPLRTSA